MPIIHLNYELELEEALENAGRKLVVVCFTSVNCGACKSTSPCFEAMSNQMPDVQFIEIIVGKDDELVEKFQILGVPTFCFYRNKSLIFRFHGGNADFLRSKVDELRFQI